MPSAVSPCLAAALLCLQPVKVAVSLAAQAPQSSRDQLVKRALPAAAAILTRNQAGGVVEVGSGFSIDSSGVVVTNWHLLKGAVRALIRLPTGEQFDAVRSFGGDSLADVALLKVPDRELPTLTTTTSIPHVGDSVVVLGRGPGISESVSQGVVSGIRVLDGRKLIEISSPVSLTSSGGPVLDKQGRVFGVVSSRFQDGEELKFVAPMRYALAILENHPASRPLDSVFPAPADPLNDRLDSELDSDEQVVRALISAQKLVLDAALPKEAMPFLEFVIANGESDRREQAAALLYSGGTALVQERDLPGAVDLLRKSISAANPSGRVAPAANYVLALATLMQVPPIDSQVQSRKSCQLARQEEALLQESEQAFGRGRNTNSEGAEKLMATVKQYQTRLKPRLKTYCQR